MCNAGYLASSHSGRHAAIGQGRCGGWWAVTGLADSRGLEDGERQAAAAASPPRAHRGSRQLSPQKGRPKAEVEGCGPERPARPNPCLRPTSTATGIRACCQDGDRAAAPEPHTTPAVRVSSLLLSHLLLLFDPQSTDRTPHRPAPEPARRPASRIPNAPATGASSRARARASRAPTKAQDKISGLTSARPIIPPSAADAANVMLLVEAADRSICLPC